MGDTQCPIELQNTISEIARNTGVTDQQLSALLENDDFLRLVLAAFEKRALLLFANLGQRQKELQQYLNAEGNPRQKALAIQAAKLSFEIDRFLIERGSPMFSPRQRIESTFSETPAEQRAQAWQLAEKMRGQECTEVESSG